MISTNVVISKSRFDKTIRYRRGYMISEGLGGGGGEGGGLGNC